MVEEWEGKHYELDCLISVMSVMRGICEPPGELLLLLRCSL